MRIPIHLFANTSLRMGARITYDLVSCMIYINDITQSVYQLECYTYYNVACRKLFIHYRKLKYKKIFSIINKTT